MTQRGRKPDPAAVRRKLEDEWGRMSSRIERQLYRRLPEKTVEVRGHIIDVVTRTVGKSSSRGRTRKK